MERQIDDLKMSLAKQGISGLALDIDETLSWTIGYWVERMQELFGNPEHLTPRELIAKYRYTQYVPYWQTEEALAWMEEHRNANDLQEALPLIQGANKAIHKIHEATPIVTYLTTRPSIVIPGTKAWLKKHGFPEVEVIARPPSVPSSEGNAWKAGVLELLYPQVIGVIDDNPALVTSLSPSYKGTVYLYDNTDHPRQDITIIPGKSWRELEEKIHKRSRS